jgi:hypothetical protein
MGTGGSPFGAVVQAGEGSVNICLERVAEAIGNSGCTCDGQGSWIVVRYVEPGDPLEEPGEPGERRSHCLQHPPRLRFERFDKARGAWVESRSGAPDYRCRLRPDV